MSKRGNKTRLLPQFSDYKVTIIMEMGIEIYFLILPLLWSKNSSVKIGISYTPVSLVFSC